MQNPIIETENKKFFKTLGEELWFIHEYLVFKKQAFTVRMFGGIGYYFNDRLIVTLFNFSGNKSFKGKKYKIELWQGAFFPVEKQHQPSVIEQFPFLSPHPILGKWLYLPLQTDEFIDQVEQVLPYLLRPGSLFGTVPKKKKPKANKILNIGKITAEELKSATKIKTPADLKKMGWQRAFGLLVKKYPHRLNRNMARSLMAACLKKSWRELSTQELVQLEREFLKLKQIKEIKDSR